MNPSEFSFPELDEVGIDTLDAISFAPRFNRWMYENIKDFCHGEILEIGSGIGNISAHFREEGASIQLSDIRGNYIDILNTSFGDSAQSVLKMDISAPDFNTRYADLIEKFDSIFALNVVEHIKDDALAIKNCRKLLKPGGQLTILVPAYQALYNSFDTALEHYRRYTKKSLNSLFTEGFKISKSRYFNAFGMLGWVVSGSILKKKTIAKSEMQLYDKLLFIAKTIDFLCMNKIGLSVISSARKV